MQGADAVRRSANQARVPEPAPLCGEDPGPRLLPGGQDGGGDELLGVPHQSDMPLQSVE